MICAHCRRYVDIPAYIFTVWFYMRYKDKQWQGKCDKRFLFQPHISICDRFDVRIIYFTQDDMENTGSAIRYFFCK